MHPGIGADPRPPGGGWQGLLAEGFTHYRLFPRAQSLASHTSWLGLSHRRRHSNICLQEGKGEKEKSPTALLYPEPP